MSRIYVTWGEVLVERQQIFLEVVRLAEAPGRGLAPTQQIEMLRGQPITLPAAEASDDELSHVAQEIASANASARHHGLGIFGPPHGEQMP